MSIERVTARGIILKDDKIFAVRQKIYSSGEPADFWCLPGGRLEAGEDLTECLVRELMEELGVKPVVGSLLYVHQFMDGKNQVLELIFNVTNADDFLAIDLGKTSHGQREIAEYGFVNPSSTKILPEFLRQEDLGLSVQNGATKLFSYL